MITPKRPSGFNELLPADQLAFNAMVSVIKMSYEQYGYAPIETPALELAPILLAKEGGETSKQVYRFNKGDADLTLRFDLTIPLARYAAEHYNELAFPFRRYQIQEVWRAEKPQAGRYRQFYQCDIDTLGSKDPMADVDTILAARAALHALGLKVIFKISHRGFLSGWLEAKKAGKNSAAVLRAIDKLDKQGETVVMNELSAAGLKKTDAKALLIFVKHSGATKEILKFLSETEIKNPIFTKALEDLKQITSLLSAAGVKPSEFVIDLSIARGLDYYTGLVFETFLVKDPKIGSICSGGRYDNLLGQYRRDPIPGVGTSIGLSRLFSAIKKDLANGPSNPAQILLVSLGEDVATYALKVATTLRQHNFNVLVYPGFDKVGKQLGYADKLGIPLAILCGSNEADKNSVTIKNMKTGKQLSVALSKAAAAIRKML